MEETFSLSKLPEIADKVISDASNKTILFYGEMGVGKTTFIKELAKILGANDLISSPTYSIVNEYEIENDKIYHFDCYRLENEEEALDIGIEDYFESGHWNFVEWPEKIKNLLPESRINIELSRNSNGTRTINMTPVN